MDLGDFNPAFRRSDIDRELERSHEHWVYWFLGLCDLSVTVFGLYHRVAKFVVASFVVYNRVRSAIMSHTQPSPTGAVTPHHSQITLHPQVNGHVALQTQPPKAPVPPTTAQKLTALNEQVWLSIGMSSRLGVSHPVTNSGRREPVRNTR